MASNKALTQSIIKTLCYAQIFAFPLTETELWQYLLHHKKISKKVFLRHLYQNLHAIEQIQDFFVLRGDQKLVGERIKRHTYSAKKFKKAYLVSQILFYIPTIKLIGVSGSLSMYNAKKEDDIDLFFITSKNSLWTTRFMVNLVLLLLGQKRMRGEHFAKDKICPNMFMSEEVLQIKKRDQNIYTAHEVIQMKVLFSRDNIYSRFLARNVWVLEYMPNAFFISTVSKSNKNSSGFFSKILLPLEKFLYQAQHFYMRKRITYEEISRTAASFHPTPHKKAVLELYHLKTLHQATSYNKQKHANLASNYRHVN